MEFYTDSRNLVLNRKSRPVAETLEGAGYQVQLPEAVVIQIEGRKEPTLVGFLKHGKVMVRYNNADAKQVEACKGLGRVVDDHSIAKFNGASIFV